MAQVLFFSPSSHFSILLLLCFSIRETSGSPMDERFRFCGEEKKRHTVYLFTTKEKKERNRMGLAKKNPAGNCTTPTVLTRYCSSCAVPPLSFSPLNLVKNCAYNLNSKRHVWVVKQIEFYELYAYMVSNRPSELWIKLFFCHSLKLPLNHLSLSIFYTQNVFGALQSCFKIQAYTYHIEFLGPIWNSSGSKNTDL